jgi:CheY-like chemotaxis protein
VESMRAVEGRDHELIVVPSPSPIYLDADAVRLTQVFLNLLNNAFKFTPKAGRITLSVKAAADHVDVRIQDTGQGIAADDLARVFEMFYQGAGGAHKAGLGLGLTLVQKLVEMHGGSVSAHSSGLGGGSEFRVRLPIVPAPVQAEMPAGPALPANGAAGRRILVVDDNRDAVESLAELLRMSGSEVGVAFDGEEAIRAASEFQPEVVLLDIGMPIVDGYTAAKTIRSQSNGRGVWLVAMTGWGQAEDKLRAQEAGFDAHLVKPISIDAVLSLLASFQAGAPSKSAAQ